MADIPSNGRDLGAIYNQRQSHWGPKYASYSEVEMAIRGDLPDSYDKLFGRNDVRLKIKTIRTADDDLTALTAKVFPISVTQRGNSETKRKADERVERIAYSWNDGAALRGGPEMDGTMFKLARHQVRFGDGCLLALPDHARKAMFFDTVDPRCHFPPVGWTPWMQTPLDNTLIVTEMTLGEVKARYPEAVPQLNNVYKQSNMYGDRINNDETQNVKVGQFYSRDSWYVATLGHDQVVVLAESHKGDAGHPGVCPVISFQQFESDPLFSGQVGIEAALMKVLNQEIRGADQMLSGPIFGPKLMGDTVNWTGYNVIDTMSQQGAVPPVNRLAPTSPLNTERVLGSLVGLARVLNRNPESFQGGGDANSAKAIQTLQSGIKSTVQDILWQPFKSGFPRAYDVCRETELALWANERKQAYGTKGKSSFEVDYIPSVHLAGYEGRIKIEPGYGLGGYQAQLQALQEFGAGVLPLRMVLEQNPGIRDVDSTMRELESEQLAKLADAAFEALAQADPMTAIKATAQIRKLVANGKSKFDALQQVIEEGGLTPPQPEAPPMGPEGGAMPPDLMAMLGGGGGEQAALPPPAGVLP